jgi:hypothetical protein
LKATAGVVLCGPGAEGGAGEQGAVGGWLIGAEPGRSGVSAPRRTRAMCASVAASRACRLSTGVPPVLAQPASSSIWGEVPERIGDGLRAGRDGGQRQQAGVGLVAGGLGRWHLSGQVPPPEAAHRAGAARASARDLTSAQPSKAGLYWSSHRIGGCWAPHRQRMSEVASSIIYGHSRLFRHILTSRTVQLGNQ